LAASIQPHGVLLVLDEGTLAIEQASANTGPLLGIDVESLLHQPIAALGGDLEARLRHLPSTADFSEPAPIQCHTIVSGCRYDLEGSVHRHPRGGLIVELEPIHGAPGSPSGVGMSDEVLLERLASTVQKFSNASNIGGLADAAVKAYRDLTGYDRVMVYKFDPDGHGKIIAEARDPRLESLLGHHYPASDIPQRARELYVRNRVRVLVDVHYQPVPLVPRLHPPTGEDLDMSLCYLRSMSPLHLQYLKNMGVTATLVVSLIREGRLWGLIAAHHYSPRNLRFSLRMAADMLAEVMSTRLAAIENYAHAQVAILVRRLEHRLIEATSAEGDWRLALFRNPRTLLQPLEATGAALFYDDEILTSGEVPSTPELRSLLRWVEEKSPGGQFQCSSVGRECPELDGLTPMASGVLAVKLSTSRPEYLMWFRKEQLLTVTWAGDPSKPVIGNNPLELSPRRSFAAWSEIVRGTALPWSGVELALARAIGDALIDIILQVQAVRLLIAEHQLGQIRATVGNSAEPVVISDANSRILFANDSFHALIGSQEAPLRELHDIARLFTRPDEVASTLRRLSRAHQPWRGELFLARRDGQTLPVSVRAEVVPGPDGSVLGFIMILIDLTERARGAAARQQLEEALSGGTSVLLGVDGGDYPPRASDEVINAILTNASLAAMDIADAASTPSVAPLLEELEASTKRATALYSRIRTHRIAN
jgi:PAS domain S-box-containing protein